MATAMAMAKIGMPHAIVRQLFIVSPLNLRFTGINVSGAELFHPSFWMNRVCVGYANSMPSAANRR